MPDKSTHRCEVIEVIKQPHPNADKLKVVDACGYQVCVNDADWPEGKLGAYVVPDSVVDSRRPEFAFLADQAKEDGSYRVRVKRLRGYLSQGFLAPAPPDSKVGDDVAEALGVTRYVPPCELEAGSDNIVGPDPTLPRYDVESWQGHSKASGLLFKDLFVPGERVRVTEKIHGASARYMFAEGQMWVGSRTNWKKPDAAERQWHTALKNTPQIEAYCQKHPGIVLYGECYGQVKGMKYGRDKVGPGFVCFDIWDKTHWLDGADFILHVTFGNIPLCPLLYDGPYNEQAVLELVSGPSILAKNQGGSHIREGIVVRPYVERQHPELGRVQLKLVSDAYLEKGY